MAKRKNNKNVILTRAEKNLILKSTICEKDEELKEILEKFPISIYREDLTLIKEENERIHDILNSYEAVNLIIYRASLEWKGKEPLGKKDKPCQLCENKQSQFKHMILNTINQNTMEVGTECIKKFKGIANYSGESPKKIENWYNECPEKINRLSVFNKKFNGGKDISKSWREKYNNDFKIEFPKDYDEQLNEQVKNADKIYCDYIKGKIKESKLKGFQVCLDNFDYLYNKKCKKFIEDNKDNKYICTKRMAQVLKKNGFNETLNAIKENQCIVSKRLAIHISDSEFIKKFKDEIKSAFNNIDLQLNNISTNLMQFKYKYEFLPNSNPIFLKINLDKFMLNYSNLLYEKMNLNKVKVFNSLELEYDYNNINNFLDILEYVINNSSKRKKYSIKYDIELHEKQVIEIKNIGTKLYANMKLVDLLNIYMDVLFNEDKVLRYIEKLNWTNYKEKNKYDIGNISSIFTLDKEN